MITEKITTREVLAGRCQELRRQDKKIGFTSGAFDLLHAGHVDYLEKARALCDVLIVGLNSDKSIRKYKGNQRPLIPESQRLKVIAALESVSYVFLFDERRNKKNIEVLKPDLYIKAGDYSSETLTSREVIEKLGGETRFIPVSESVSTTEILRKAAVLAGAPAEWSERDTAVFQQRRPAKQSPALFMDRDGTINEEVSYLHRPEDFKLLPGVLGGIKKFQEMGYRIIIVTNQPGIGMGYFPEEDFFRVNREMLKQFSAAGILVDKIYFCPHSKAERCDCRKPGQLLIKRAQEELNLDLSRSVMIGDKSGDIETGRRAGMTTILITSGYGGEDQEYAVEPDLKATSIEEAAEHILQRERN